MKKTLLLIFAAAAMMLAGANASAQVSVGAGPTTRLYFEKGKNVDASYGVQVNFEDCKRVSDVFGYSAGIDLGTYGKKYSEDVSLNEVYVDIPVRMKYYIPFSDNFELFFFGGVVPSICASSNTKSEAGKFSRFGESLPYTRYDVLAGGGIGLELNESFKFSLGYDQGIMDRDKSDAVLHVAAVKFTVAFLFY